jgi:hypothetical protein
MLHGDCAFSCRLVVDDARDWNAVKSVALAVNGNETASLFALALLECLYSKQYVEQESLLCMLEKVGAIVASIGNMRFNLFVGCFPCSVFALQSGNCTTVQWEYRTDSPLHNKTPKDLLRLKAATALVCYISKTCKAPYQVVVADKNNTPC